MNELKLTGLTKYFGDFAAVRDVDLTVKPDEVLCLLGPSGCGKTTTLRMIAGLESATQGAVYFGDRDVTHLPARDRDVAMAFQFYALYPDLTVGQNLAYPLQAEAPTPAESADRLARIAEILQLTEVLDRYPHQLSEGEKQRVAVGRCVIRAPNAFLFDEPLSRLDAKLRDEMRGSIRKILATLDRPTVIVTHDQLEAMTMGDRIAVMRDGKVEQIGRPLDVFERPANIFVAGFIGTPQMNLLKGRCLAVNDTGLEVDLSGQMIRLPSGPFATLPQTGAEVTLGFRPRAAARAQDDAVSLQAARVFLSENMGAETLVHSDWNGQNLRVLAHGPGHPEGQVHDVQVDPADLTLFGADGIRITRKSDKEAA
ncbi:sn-glycerol-3-phosphate import ATP-binding protein UgpC 2 [Rhodobacteraceae bacterium KLH11]|nr:sn-glycerol-3-phosphate import ATP-binding protein UgpC 2 [Rhodobacteraceae bacterium KLH11]